ncbi:hypothetical protein ACFLXY_09305 [Chloroflexota bacterium]
MEFIAETTFSGFQNVKVVFLRISEKCQVLYRRVSSIIFLLGLIYKQKQGGEKMQYLKEVGITIIKVIDLLLNIESVRPIQAVYAGHPYIAYNPVSI